MSYQDALDTALVLGMRPLAALCHLGLGRLGAHRGRSGEAETHLEAAARLLTEMGMVLWLPVPDLLSTTT